VGKQCRFDLQIGVQLHDVPWSIEQHLDDLQTCVISQRPHQSAQYVSMILVAASWAPHGRSQVDAVEQPAVK
jgi:hypothetical protein